MTPPVSDWITATLILGMVVTAGGTWLVFFFGARLPGRKGAIAVAVAGVGLLAWLAASVLLGLYGFLGPNHRARFPHIALGFTPILVGLAAYAVFTPLRDAVRRYNPTWSSAYSYTGSSVSCSWSSMRRAGCRASLPFL